MLSQKTINDFIFIFFVIYIIPIIIGSFVFILTRNKKKIIFKSLLIYKIFISFT